MTEDQSAKAAPVTYFHKVASPAHRDEPDLLTPDGPSPGDEQYTSTIPNRVAAVASPEGLITDEDDDGDARDENDEVVPVTRADALASTAETAPGPAQGPAQAADSNQAAAAPPAGGFGSLLPETADLRAQWHQIQFKFVDDPRASVTEAADIIEQVAARLQAAIQERQRGLRGRWDGGVPADTETLRETLRMYRAFLYQLIGSGGT